MVDGVVVGVGVQLKYASRCSTPGPEPRSYEGTRVL